MGKLIINTGVISLDIEDSDGTKRGTFRFNPRDILIAKRMLDMQAELNEKMSEFQQREEAITKPEEKVDFLYEVTEYYRKKIDDIFGAGSSQILFGDAHTLGMISDFVDGVTPYFNTASKNRMDKYKKNKG